MKIIHTADIHLGSKMDTRFPKEISAERKEEVRNTFRRMVEYARSDGVKAIILAGDVFDSDRPFNKDKEFFYSVVLNNPEIDFLYLKGNHDISENYSGVDIPNLKMFSSQWTTYRYEGLTISGAETQDVEFASLPPLKLDKDLLNIVVLHGQAAEYDSKNTINLKRLRDKNIDYLALGHIHKHSEGKLDGRGVYVYSGCPEGRGFDEAGQCGFVLIDAEEKITYSFIPFAERRIVHLQADISGATEAYGAFLKINEQIKFYKKYIYRIDLKGKINFDVERLESDLEKYLSGQCYFVSVKDKTERLIDIAEFEKDISVKGEFVRTVMASAEYSREEKLKIIDCGLRALAGREIEL